MRKTPRRSLHRPLSTGSVQTIEEHADGTWTVATWVGRSEAGVYSCPICGARLPGTASHLVVWLQDQGPAARRHVHRGCWQRRGRMPDPVRW